MIEKIDGLNPDFQQWLKGILHDTDVRVIFTKKDGTEREMLCTLAETKIPEEQKPKTDGSNFSNEAQRVFDLEKQEWRSFRWDSIKNISFTIS
jgi:hypothetical protein